MMDHEHWLGVWQRNAIGFHQDAVNPALRKFWRTLGLRSGDVVFVPMCGKSSDMVWLREQGHSVVGVELSQIAIDAFYAEHPAEASGIRIIAGDFFALRPADLGEVKGIYDRAALIALPADMRVQYAQSLMNLVPRGTKMLLVALEYEQAEMNGPPFSVSGDEVEALYGTAADNDVRLLERVDVTAANPGLQQRGVSRLIESVYQITFATSSG